MLSPPSLITTRVFLSLPAECELMQRHFDCVVKRGPAFRDALPQGGPQLSGVIGKGIRSGSPRRARSLKLTTKISS